MPTTEELIATLGWNKAEAEPSTDELIRQLGGGAPTDNLSKGEPISDRSTDELIRQLGWGAERPSGGLGAQIGLGIPKEGQTAAERPPVSPTGLRQGAPGVQAADYGIAPEKSLADLMIENAPERARIQQLGVEALGGEYKPLEPLTDEEHIASVKKLLRFEGYEQGTGGFLRTPRDADPKGYRRLYPPELGDIQDTMKRFPEQFSHDEKVRAERYRRREAGLLKTMGEEAVFTFGSMASLFGLGERFIPGLKEHLDLRSEAQLSPWELRAAGRSILKGGAEMAAVGYLFKGLQYASPIANKVIQATPGLRRIGPAVGKAIDYVTLAKKSPVVANVVKGVMREASRGVVVGAEVATLKTIGYDLSTDEALETFKSDMFWFGTIGAVYGAAREIDILRYSNKVSKALLAGAEKNLAYKGGEAFRQRWANLKIRLREAHNLPKGSSERVRLAREALAEYRASSSSPREQELASNLLKAHQSGSQAKIDAAARAMNKYQSRLQSSLLSPKELVESRAALKAQKQEIYRQIRAATDELKGNLREAKKLDPTRKLNAEQEAARIFFGKKIPAIVEHIQKTGGTTPTQRAVDAAVAEAAVRPSTQPPTQPAPTTPTVPGAPARVGQPPLVAPSVPPVPAEAPAPPKRTLAETYPPLTPPEAQIPPEAAPRQQAPAAPEVPPPQKNMTLAAREIQLEGDSDKPLYYRPVVAGRKIYLFRGLQTGGGTEEAASPLRAIVRWFSQSPRTAENYANQEVRVDYEKEEVVAPETGYAPRVIEVEHTPRKVLDLTTQAWPEWLREPMKQDGIERFWQRAQSPREGVETVPLGPLHKAQHFWEAIKKRGYDTIVFRDYSTVGIDNSVVVLGKPNVVARYNVSTNLPESAQGRSEWVKPPAPAPKPLAEKPPEVLADYPELAKETKPAGLSPTGLPEPTGLPPEAAKPAPKAAEKPTATSAQATPTFDKVSRITSGDLYVLRIRRRHPTLGTFSEEYQVVGAEKARSQRLYLQGRYKPRSGDVFRLETGKMPEYQPKVSGPDLLAELKKKEHRFLAATFVPPAAEKPAPAPKAEAPARPKDLLGQDIGKEKQADLLAGKAGRGVEAIWQTINGVDYILPSENFATRADGTGLLIPKHDVEALKADALEAKPPAEVSEVAEEALPEPTGDFMEGLVEPPAVKPKLGGLAGVRIAARSEVAVLSQLSAMGKNATPTEKRLGRQIRDARRLANRIKKQLQDDPTIKQAIEMRESTTPLLDYLGKTRITYRPTVRDKTMSWKVKVVPSTMGDEITEMIAGKPLSVRKHFKRIGVSKPGQPVKRNDVDEILDNAQRAGIVPDDMTDSEFLEQIIAEAQGEFGGDIESLVEAGVDLEKQMYGDQEGVGDELLALERRYNQALTVIDENTAKLAEIWQAEPAEAKLPESTVEKAMAAEKAKIEQEMEKMKAGLSNQQSVNFEKYRALLKQESDLAAKQSELARLQKKAQEKVERKRARLAKIEGQRPPEGVRATKQQMATAHITASRLNLISAKGKPTQGYRRLAKGMTGQTSMKMMTKEDAAEFIEALEKLQRDDKMGISPPRKPGEPPTIAMGSEIIPADFLNEYRYALGVRHPDIAKWLMLPVMRSIMPKGLGLRLIGMEKYMAGLKTGKELSMIEAPQLRGFVRRLIKAVNKAGQTSLKERVLARVLNRPTKAVAAMRDLLDAYKNPPDFLSDEDKRLFGEFRAMTESLLARENAGRKAAGLPPIPHVESYITHLVDVSAKQTVEDRHPFPEELSYILSEQTLKSLSKKPFNPTALERTIKEEITEVFSRDLAAAMNMLIHAAMKDIHITPQIARFRGFKKLLEPLLPEQHRKMVEAFVKYDILGRPLEFDKAINTVLGPGRDFINDILKPLRRRVGQPAAALTQPLRKGAILGGLALRPKPVERNWLQRFLVLNITGPGAFIKAFVKPLPPGVKEQLKTTIFYKLSTRMAEDIAEASGVVGKISRLPMKPYQLSHAGAGRFLSNVDFSLAAGYWRAVARMEWCQSAKGQAAIKAAAEKLHAKNPKLSVEWLTKRMTTTEADLIDEAVNVARATQWGYYLTEMPYVFRGQSRRALLVFQSWWMNYLGNHVPEAMIRAFAGKTSTGKLIPWHHRFDFLKGTLIIVALTESLRRAFGWDYGRFYNPWGALKSSFGISPAGQFLLGMWFYLFGRSNYDKGHGEWLMKRSFSIQFPYGLAIKEWHAYMKGETTLEELLFYMDEDYWKEKKAREAPAPKPAPSRRRRVRSR